MNGVRCGSRAGQLRNEERCDFILLIDTVIKVPRPTPLLPSPDDVPLVGRSAVPSAREEIHSRSLRSEKGFHYLCTALLGVRAIWFDAWQGSRGVDRWLERRYDQGDQTRRMHAGSSRPSPDRNRRRVLIGIVRTASRVPLALEHPPRPASSSNTIQCFAGHTIPTLAVFPTFPCP